MAIEPEAIERCEQFAPDVVLLDISLPDMTVINAARYLIERQPATRIVFVSSHTFPDSIQEALLAGGRGYVAKNAALEQLLPAISCALEGKSYSPNAKLRSGVISENLPLDESSQPDSATLIVTPTDASTPASVLVKVPRSIVKRQPDC